MRVFLRVVFSAVQTRLPACCSTIHMYFHDVTGAMQDTFAVSPSSELHNMHVGQTHWIRDRDDCSEHAGFGRS